MTTKKCKACGAPEKRAGGLTNIAPALGYCLDCINKAFDQPILSPFDQLATVEDETGYFRCPQCTSWVTELYGDKSICGFCEGGESDELET